MIGSVHVGSCRKCGQSLEPMDTECPSCGYGVALPPAAEEPFADSIEATPAAAKAVLVVGAYSIAMALGLVLALGLGFGVSYLGWVVVEDEFLVEIGFGLMLGGWLLGPVVGVSFLYFWRRRAGGPRSFR